MKLLEETIEILQNHNKTLEDILWFGSKDVELKGDLKKALDFDYDKGCGCQEVLEDLVLVGKDFWLERHEYDGSEWWEYKELPTRPEKVVDLGLKNMKVESGIDCISPRECGDTYSLVKNPPATTQHPKTL